jgi:menaquinone-dependent protoporphyrinogen IX oxidase
VPDVIEVVLRHALVDQCMVGQCSFMAVPAEDDLMGPDTLITGKCIRPLSVGPSAFFSVNVVARKPGKRQADTNPYARKLLRQIAWQPENLAVFAGRIDCRRYGFLDRNIIRLIMWITNGPTDPTTDIEFTDWAQVEEFGHSIAGR